jgi:endonuclease III related protein
LIPDEHIRTYFRTLYGAWGHQHWWPAQTAFEVIVGAYLTQNTSWTNVERAMESLRKARVLSAGGIRRMPLRRLELLIRSSGYFRQKAQRLKTFVKFLDERYGGSVSRMFGEPTTKLRAELLGLDGVGPETADSILLYAGNHASFVVDAYTRRILERHELVEARAGYEEIRQLFERSLEPLAEETLACASRTTEDGAPRGSSHPPSRMSAAKRDAIVQVFNEMHGLIVGVGKHYCKKSQPECEQCPLQKFLPGAGSSKHAP